MPICWKTELVAETPSTSNIISPLERLSDAAWGAVVFTAFTTLYKIKKNWPCKFVPNYKNVKLVGLFIKEMSYLYVGSYKYQPVSLRKLEGNFILV